jgi:predicted transcriptional regulator
MTAKEKLRERVESLSEEEADVALLLVERRLDDPMLRALAKAPEDDEPWSAEDEAAIAEVAADVEAGRTISHEEMLRKHG